MYKWTLGNCYRWNQLSRSNVVQILLCIALIFFLFFVALFSLFAQKLTKTKFSESFYIYIFNSEWLGLGENIKFLYKKNASASMERALSIRLPKRFLWPHVLVDFQAKWFRTVDFQFRISYQIQFTAVAQRIQSQAIQRKNRCVHGQMTLTICKCEWLTFSNGMAKCKKK